MAQVVAKAKIGESGDYNLSGDRYLNSLIIDSDYPRISLGDACKIYNGSTPSKEVKEYWHEGTGIVSSTFCKSVEYPSSAAKLGS
jgi:type I restriction enzyme M protein